ncbi:MAG: Ig-like domain-containing protein, partial [Verrucomicrobiales bacterium]|nr:Ig-like domain-containing protein [Verrucomicrobiales bacterium]
GAKLNGVATSGDTVYVALANGDWVKVSLSTGEELTRFDAENTAQDIAVESGRVYVLTSTSLRIYLDSANPPVLLGSIDVTGNASPLESGRKLFVGNGLAYIGHFLGYNVIDVSNPQTPTIVGSSPQTQPAVHHIVANGSGLVLPITSFAGPGSLRLSVYDGADPTAVDQLITHFETPGGPRSVLLHRGLAYVADSAAGIQVINVFGPDTAGLPPSTPVVTAASFSLAPPQAEVDRLAWTTVLTQDDVHLSEVELYLNGELAARDGNHPFELTFRTPRFQPNAQSLTVRFRAVDVAGNGTWSDSIDVQLVDTSPPNLIASSPSTNAVVESGTVTLLKAQFDEPLKPPPLVADTFRLWQDGPDGELGTLDDAAVLSGNLIYDASTATLQLPLLIPLPAGEYRAVVASSIADRSGNSPAQAISWTFDVRDPNVWLSQSGGLWSVATNWSGGAIRDFDRVEIDVPGTEITTIANGTFTIAKLKSEEHFSLTGGTLNVMDEAVISGLFTWTGQSTLSGGGTTYANGGMVIDGSLKHALGDHTLINNGIARWLSGLIAFSRDAATFHNTTNGVFELANVSFANLASDSGIMPPGFLNHGVFRKTGQAAARLTTIPFHNHGSVEVEAGTLEFYLLPLSGKGTIIVRAGAELDLILGRTETLIEGTLSLEEGGTLSFSSTQAKSVPGSEIIGPGTVSFGTATFPNVAPNPEISGSYNVGRTEIRSRVSFQSWAKTGTALLDAELSGSGAFDCTGAFDWRSGRMTGGGTTIVRGPLMMEGTGNRLLMNRTLQIEGTAVFSDGTLSFADTAIIDIQPSGTLRLAADLNQNVAYSNQPWLIRNQGTLIMTSGGNTRLSAPLENSGLCHIETGTLTIGGPVRQLAGELRLTGAKLITQKTEAAGFVVEGGRVTGFGELGFPTGRDTIEIINHAVFDPGLPENKIGNFALTGSYRQSATGRLVIDLAGPPESNAFDRLTATRALRLDGTLEIRVDSGFQPVAGASYTIAQGASLTGKFATLAMAPGPGNARFNLVYSDDRLDLVVEVGP